MGDRVPVANTSKKETKGNGWCFYQAVIEAAGASSTDAESLELAKDLVGVLRDPMNAELKIGGQPLKTLLSDISDGYLTRLYTARNAADLNDGPQEWADGVLMSIAYTIKKNRVINIYNRSGDSYSIRSSSKVLERADGKPLDVKSGGSPLNLIFTETTDGEGHKAGHFDWFASSISGPSAAPLVATSPAPSIMSGFASRLQGAAKAAIADAKLRLKTGSANEIIIAGERVRTNNDANYVRHPDVAPISFYLDNPNDAAIKVLREIFIGVPEFDEENPLPPCDGDKAGILMSALERRMGLLSDEIREKRTSTSIKTKALIRHYRKLEVMVDSLNTSVGCNKYGEVPPDTITIQQQNRIEDLTRQFAFLVLQGIDPIDISGDQDLVTKAGNAQSLISLLEVNMITENELTQYLNMRKTIPTFIMNILDKSGAGRAGFQNVIDGMALQRQTELALRVIQIVEESTIGDEFASVSSAIRAMPSPGDKIVGVVEWVVSQYVQCNAAAAAAADRINRLTDQADTLQASIDTLTAENARMVQQRDASITGRAEAEAALTRAEGDRDAAVRDKQAVSGLIEAKVEEIGELQAELGRVKGLLASEQEKVNRASGVQAGLDRVNAQLASMTSDRDRLAAELRPLRDRAAAAEAALAKATGRASQAEAALAEYKAANPGSNTGELAALRGELAAAKVAVTAAQAAAATAAADIQAADARAAAAEDATRAADQRALTAEAKVTQLNAEMRRVVSDLADKERRLREAAADVDKLRAHIDSLNSGHKDALDTLARERDAKAAEAGNIRGAVGVAAAGIEDARRALAAKQAEIDDLKRKYAEQADSLRGLQEAAAAAQRALEAEQSQTAKLMNYLGKLSTAVTNGTELPVFDGPIPQIKELMEKINKLRANGDPSRYLCLLSYYVKFFMTLLFNQPGGKGAYSAVKDYVGVISGKSDLYLTSDECYALLETLKPNLDDGFNVELRDTGLDTILKNVFGDAGNTSKSVALFTVVTQIYLSKLYSIGKLPGCRVAPIITDPTGNMRKGDGIAVPAVPAVPAAPIPRYNPYTPDPIPEPSPAAQRAFNVEEVDRAPSIQPDRIAYAADAHTKFDAERALQSVQSIINKAVGGNGFAAKPLVPVEKSTYRAESKIIADYCSYGKDSRHPLSRYPQPDNGVCQLYEATKAKLNRTQKGFDNGIPRL
jgi:predicted  nucleic acid-binding Zn-ribbon protein